MLSAYKKLNEFFILLNYNHYSSNFQYIIYIVKYVILIFLRPFVLYFVTLSFFLREVFEFVKNVIHKTGFIGYFSSNYRDSKIIGF